MAHGELQMLMGQLGQFIGEVSLWLLGKFPFGIRKQELHTLIPFWNLMCCSSDMLPPLSHRAPIMVWMLQESMNVFASTPHS